LNNGSKGCWHSLALAHLRFSACRLPRLNRKNRRLVLTSPRRYRVPRANLLAPAIRYGADGTVLAQQTSARIHGADARVARRLHHARLPRCSGRRLPHSFAVNIV